MLRSTYSTRAHRKNGEHFADYEKHENGWFFVYVILELDSRKA